MKKSFPKIFIICLFVLSSVIRVLAISNHNFAFTIDQGRDLVDIRQMVVGLKPRLVGPTTSLNGVLLGPAWYYFNLPAFILSGGDPGFITLWQVIWYQLIGLFMYYLFSKQNRPFALIFSLFYFFLPLGFNTTRYFWNANAMVFFTGLFLGSLFYFLSRPTSKKALIHGLICGICLQIEAAFAILFLPFSLLFFIFKKQKVNALANLILGFSLTLIPQMIFEFRHQFLMTKIFLNEFLGKGDVLGQKLTFLERFYQRRDLLVDLIRNSSHLPFSFWIWFFAFSFFSLLVLFFLKKLSSTQKLIFELGLGFLVLSSIFYMIFPQQVKAWYPLGLSVFLILFPSVFLSFLFDSKKRLFRIVVSVIISAIIYFSLSAQYTYLTRFAFVTSNDKSNLKNELAAIDWIYGDANSRDFRVYNYLPSIYDYPYQYLFWWYGPNRYGYQPEIVSYGLSVPEYIPDNYLFWTKTKKMPADLIYLVIERDLEMPSRENNWRNQFKDFCIKDQTLYPWGTMVVKMEKCH